MERTMRERSRHNRNQSPLLGGVRVGLSFVLLAAFLVGPTLAGDAVFTNKARFRIPYQLDQSEIKRLKASEIQLHVTTDGGQQWRHVDSVPPVNGKFTFEAAKDGEYGFSVRTVGEDGRKHPAGPLTTGLKVIVDTSKPVLQLQVTETSPGQAMLQWSAADDHLDIDSLVLEQRDASGEWQTISVAPMAAGQTSWSVPNGGNVAVRGRIVDAAGNESIDQTQVELSGVVTPQQPAVPSQARQPIAEGPFPQLPDAVTSNDTSSPQTTTAQPMTPQATGGGLPVINPNGGSSYNQYVSQRAAQTQSTPTHPAMRTPAPTLPQQTSHVRRVNSTNFQIGYALDDVGPSGVSSVDLYLSEDEGRKWFHYGVDEDGSSPFEVSVPSDGAYGFAIRVRSGVGLAQTPPQPGDRSEVTIVVDRKAPQVSLLPLKQGHGKAPNEVLIEWTMSDEQLSERPVSLYYSPRASGPWQPITGWEPNNGQYVWTFGPEAPKQVYIRLEARDAAGNIARVETENPMLIDLSRPTARIIDVESMSTGRY